MANCVKQRTPFLQKFEDELAIQDEEVVRGTAKDVYFKGHKLSSKL